MTTHTNQEIIEAAEKIVANKGADYVYPDYRDGCTYSDDDGNPSCIVGHIVAELDPESFERLVAVENSDEEIGRVLLSNSARYLNRDAETEYTDSQLSALRRAQEEQDSGRPWGEALDALRRGLGA